MYICGMLQPKIRGEYKTSRGLILTMSLKQNDIIKDAKELYNKYLYKDILYNDEVYYVKGIEAFMYLTGSLTPFVGLQVKKYNNGNVY